MITLFSISVYRINIIHHKPWTIANQSAVPNEQCLSVICFSSVEAKSKIFKNRFAVADIEYNLIGTPFFNRNTQKNQFQVFSRNFKYSFNGQPTTACLTTLIEKNLPFFPKLHLTSQLISNPTLYKPCNSNWQKNEENVAWDWKFWTNSRWNTSNSFSAKTKTMVFLQVFSIAAPRLLVLSINRI